MKLSAQKKEKSSKYMGATLSSQQTKTYSQLIHRYYTKQKGNPGFNKRVTSFEIAPLEFHQKKHYAVVKYCRVFRSIAMGQRKAKRNEDKEPLCWK